MNLDNMHFSVDTETLAFNDNALLTSIAITPFHFKNDKDVTFTELLERTYYAKLSHKPQLYDIKRSIDGNTVDFWKRQSKELRDMSVTPSDTDRDLKEVFLVEIPLFLQKHSYSYFDSYMFERGMGYDSNKIDTMYRQLGETQESKRIINYWKFREIRTINDILGDTSNGKWELPEGRPAEFIEHVANHDSAMDALRLIRLVNEVYFS